MIRTVLAVVLSLSLLALSMPAVDHGASASTERGLEADLSTLEEEAIALAESEELPPSSGPGPQRVVTIMLPAESLTTVSIEYVAVGGALESTAEADDSPLVAYRLEGEPERIVHVDAPIRSADGEPLVLRGTGNHDLRLTLEEEDGERVVVVTRR